MKKTLTLVVLLLISTHLFAQRSIGPQQNGPYRYFYTSFYDFDNNYSWYNPYYTPAPKEDYYTQLKKRKEQASKNKLNSDLYYIIPTVEKALDKVPDIGYGPAPQCSVPPELPPQEIKSVITKPKLPEVNKLTLKDGFNKRCENFLNAEGKAGPWGKYIEDYLDKNSTQFFNPALPGMQSIPKTCPNWGEFSDETKKYFWIWMFASIAQVESSCKSDAVNTGKVPNPTDRPRGLLQLNTLQKSRSWRGKNCKFPSDHASVNNPENNIKCGLDIMNEILKGKKGVYKTNGKIFPTNSYWEKLRPNHSDNGGPIGKLVRKFKPCGATP